MSPMCLSSKRFPPVFVPPHLLLLPPPPPPGLGSPLGVSGIPFLSRAAPSCFGACRPSCCLSRCRRGSLRCVCSPRPPAPHRDSPDLELKVAGSESLTKETKMRLAVFNKCESHLDQLVLSVVLLHFASRRVAMGSRMDVQCHTVL